MENTKKCVRCGEVKLVELFPKCLKMRDGLFSYCKLCRNNSAKASASKKPEEYKKKRQEKWKNISQEEKDKKNEYKRNHYRENNDQLRLRNRQYYQENKDRILENSQRWNDKNRDKLSEYYKDYYRRNKEKVLTYSKQYRQKNLEHLTQKSKEWKQRNKAKVRSYRAKRNFFKHKNGLFKISEKEIDRLLSKKCYLCGEKDSEHIDHVIPLSRGGSHSIGNLLGACSACNLSKGAKLLIQYKRDKIN
jgi:5-methylcytosine-specific restriction endonuclease McrA